MKHARPRSACTTSARMLNGPQGTNFWHSKQIVNSGTTSCHPYFDVSVSGISDLNYALQWQQRTWT